MLTGVVRCDPVVRGPDVAPVWPRCGWHAAGTAVEPRRQSDGQLLGIFEAPG
jgi:hypothetical protein